MPSPAEIDITADRQVPFFEHYAFLERDFTGSSFAGQLRGVKDTTGSPLIDFSPGIVLDYSGSLSVAGHIAAGRLTAEIYDLVNPATGVNYVAGDSLLLSWLRVSLDVPSIAFVPFPPELGDDAVAYYDIIRTPPASGDEIVMRGKFIVRAGVTIP
jgi:hypothetical protein